MSALLVEWPSCRTDRGEAAAHDDGSAFPKRRGFLSAQRSGACDEFIGDLAFPSAAEGGRG
jgi:hypothetical protein